MLQILFLSPERAEAKSKRRIFNGLSLEDERKKMKGKRVKEERTFRAEEPGTSYSVASTLGTRYEVRV